MNSLSVCIIAKNEENNISRCLASVEHIAEEIVVVDTGSTDNTIMIAKSFGAKIVYHEFNNDFAGARNKALDNATKDWILYLDCDEQLDYEDSYRLKEILDNDKFEGYCLSLSNIIDGKKNLTLPSLRVFKNRKEYRFVGKIHEQINPAIEAFSGKDNVDITDVKFYHYGYDENYADIPAKIKRNLAIFNSYEESEKNGFFYYNLANENLRINNLEEAIECYLKANEFEDDNGYKVYIPMYVTKAFHGLGKYKEAIDHGSKFLMSYPTYKDLYFIMTSCFYELSMFKEARDCLLKYIQYSKFDYGYPKFNFESDNDINALLLDLDNKIKNSSL